MGMREKGKSAQMRGQSEEKSSKGGGTNVPQASPVLQALACTAGFSCTVGFSLPNMPPKGGGTSVDWGIILLTFRHT